MAISRNLITVPAALALCTAQSAALAREKPIDPPSVGSCIREVDRKVFGTATDNVQYLTRTIKVKNRCDQSFNVTLDVAYQTDPKCTKLRPGKTTEFVYTVADSQPPPHEYRRIKSC